MPTRRLFLAATLLAALLTGLPAPAAERPFIIVASTTSTEASGLFTYLLPLFTRSTGIEVRVVAQGTGQALQTARDGNADVVLVHDRPAEEAFVAEGHGVKRHDVMYNDFILVGPAADPAKIGGGKDVTAALKAIAAAGAPFASRGDNSGTHRAERRFWQKVGIRPGGSWYRETGSGMGQTLNTAAAMDAYALADRGTWLNFANRQNLRLLVQGDPALFNQYGVILVNPEKHPAVKRAEGQRFLDWLVSREGQQAIAGYRINGEPLFFPNAGEGS